MSNCSPRVSARPMHAESSERYGKLKLVAVPAVLGIALTWYATVAKADGEAWITARLALIQPIWIPALGFLGASILTGLLVGIATVGEKWRAVKYVAAFAIAAVWLFQTGGFVRSDRYVPIPDWFSIAAMILAGGFFALAYAFPHRTSKKRPTWPVLAIPAAVAVLSAIKTDSVGDVCALGIFTTLSVALGAAVLERFKCNLHLTVTIAGALGLSLLIIIFRCVGSWFGAGSSTILITLAIIGIGVRTQLMEAVASWNEPSTWSAVSN